MPPSDEQAVRQAHMPPSVCIRRLRHVLRPYRRGFFLLLIPVCIALTALARSAPAEVERFYSRGIYPALSGALGRLFNIAPVSVAELAIFSAAAAAVAWLAFGIYGIIRKDRKKHRLLKMLADAGCVLGTGYFLFTIFCGFNYCRISFAEQSGLNIRPSSALELAALCAELAEQANEIRPLAAQNENGVMVFEPYSAFDVAKMAPEAMARAAVTYPVLSGFTPKPKPALASRMMSALGITGIYIPFTFEANVNTDVPHYNIPFSMMHETAHFKGFMREDEANFIAFIACREMESPAWRYSGLAVALINCGNALYAASPGLYWEIDARLSEDVKRDFADNNAYWKRFETPVSDMAEKVNDVYLKANRQLDGVKSYGRMTDLLLADYRMRHGLD